MFYKKGVLKVFAKFTGKDLCYSLFFHRAAGLEPATLIKKRLRRMSYSVLRTFLEQLLFRTSDCFFTQ